MLGMVQHIRKSPAPKPKAGYRMTNWREYDRAQVARGSITLRVDEAVIAGWGAVGGKGWRCSDMAIHMAILCALGLRAVFGLTQRQTQGFLLDVTRLLGVAVPVPHHSTFSRRAAALTRAGAGAALRWPRAPRRRRHRAQDPRRG